MSKHLLAGPRWARTTPGFYRPESTGAPTTTQRIVDAAAGLAHGAVIAGWAAAFVHGVDQFDGLDDHTMRPLDVPVLTPPGLHRQSTCGVRYVQSERSYPIQQVDGILVTTPEATVRDLARWAPNLVEAVVAIDAMLSADVVDADFLARLSRLRGPGARQANRAFELAVAGVRSSWESRLRMFWILDLGLPVPLVNRPIFDLRGGFLGAPDLLDEEAGLAMEYDGSRWRSAVEAGHRDVDQHRRDNHREEGFERTNLIVVRADKVDLTRERQLLATRLLAARSDGLQRDQTRDRWTLEAPPHWLGLPA